MRILSMFLGLGVLACASTAVAAEDAYVKVSCNAGDVTVTGVKPWKTNVGAPWKWDKGKKVSVDEEAAKFKGEKCEGVVNAFVCNGDVCKGPLPIPVKS